MKQKIFDKTVIKFLMVGILNTVVGAATIFLLYNVAHCSYWLSSSASYVGVGVVSFFLISILRSKTTPGPGGK